MERVSTSTTALMPDKFPTVMRKSLGSRAARQVDWKSISHSVVKSATQRIQVEDSGHDDAATREKVLKIARGLQLAPDPQNTATWFDAATAIP
jgi:hypothetical protein